MFIFACVLYFVSPELLDIKNFNFFSGFTLTHVIWLFLLIAILFSIIPKAKVSIGSLKNRKKYYMPIDFDLEMLKAYKKTNDRKALIIAIVWIAFNSLFWILYALNIISSKELLLLVLAFAVADIICVLFFCPFQLFLRTRCCTTCRIFVWDHLLMLTPIIPVLGFFSLSLLVLAVCFFLAWEISWHLHPEYFWDGSNKNLKCSSCNEKLCKIKKPLKA